MSMFVTRPNQGSGGGGTPTTVIDNLTSNSPTSALSANQGRVLNENAQSHADKIASTTELGHVMVDGTSILIDPATGVISAVGGVNPTGRFYEQAVLETTSIDQTRWQLPFTDFNYPQDLLIVSQNSTLLNTNMYTVTQTGNDWFVNIPNDSGYPLPIENNTVFAIAIKGFGGGATAIVQNSYEEKLVTNAIGQSKFEITNPTFDPVNDTVFPIYNSTLLSEDMYTLTVENGKHIITVLDVPIDQPIQHNSLSVKVLYNTVSDGMNAISGQLLIDSSLPEKKLMQDIQDKINLRVITFEEQGKITTGMKDAHRAIPFSCEVKSIDVTLLESSTQDLTFNILQTNDFVAWTSLLDSDIVIPANSHTTSFTLTNQVLIPKNKIVRLIVTNTFGDAKSLAINLNVRTI